MTVDGLLSVQSLDAFRPTVDRLDAALAARAITPILRWDHAAAAHRAGLELRPLLLLVFGDPRVGTPLMQQRPTAGIDLPLKLLVWEAEDATAFVGYDDPAWIRARHGIASPAGASDGMAMLLQQLAQAATGVGS